MKPRPTKFQQNMTAQTLAMMSKHVDPGSTTDPLNTVDGNSGPAFAFIKLNTSELEEVGAGALIQNRSDQAHFEIILWTSSGSYPMYPWADPDHTSVYPLPRDLPTLNSYYNFNNTLINESYVSLASYLLAPLTLGNVSINSTDPSASPLINLPVRHSAVQNV